MKQKISIITAIHNGLGFNRIYLNSLKENTVNDYELIIIDNISTDGSAEMFEQNDAIVIRNSKNYSYPYTQNQGIKIATGNYIFFLNNDLVLCPMWDKILIDAAIKNSVDIISAKGIENMGNIKQTRAYDHKWKRIKYPLLIFGTGERNLKMMHKIMYSNWKKFCGKQFQEYGLQTIEGIVGNNVMMTRKAIEKVGLWDEAIQSADFDLFMRTKKRSLEYGDIKPCHIALGAYVHHYIRMTSKYAQRKPLPFADIENLKSLKQKWSINDLDKLHPDNATIRKMFKKI